MLPTPFIKRAIPLAAQLLGISPLLLAIERRWHFPSVRAVMYHSVPQFSANQFEQQVRYYARHYSSVTLEDLDLLLHEGKWNKPKPGLMPTFDDGLRTHAEVAAPILEKYGFCGWFFLPTELLDTPIQQQRTYADEHGIWLDEDLGGDLEGDRIAMTWEQARQMAGTHVLGGHTASHVRLSKELTSEQLQYEIPDAKHYLEKQLQRSGRDVCLGRRRRVELLRHGSRSHPRRWLSIFADDQLRPHRPPDATTPNRPLPHRTTLVDADGSLATLRPHGPRLPRQTRPGSPANAMKQPADQSRFFLNRREQR